MFVWALSGFLSVKPFKQTDNLSREFKIEGDINWCGLTVM